MCNVKTLPVSLLSSWTSIVSQPTFNRGHRTLIFHPLPVKRPDLFGSDTTFKQVAGFIVASDVYIHGLF